MEPNEIVETIEWLRRHGLSNGTSLGWHNGMMDASADCIESLIYKNGCLESSIDSLEKTVAALQAQLDATAKIRDGYASAARTIHLWIKDFCDESLPYDEMIADATRKAADALTESQRQLRAAVEAVQKRMSFLEKLEAKSLVDQVNKDGVLALLDGLLAEISGPQEAGEDRT